MPEEKSILTKLTEAINSTAGLITALVGLVTLLLTLFGIPDFTSWEPTPTCNDKKMNGSETDVDCGGTCPDCVDPPNCHDNRKNGREEEIDCGGNCPPCPVPPTTSGFTNLKHVTVEDGWLIKSISSKGWNAGATSKKHLPAGVAGGVRYRIDPDVGHFLFGLTPFAGDAGYEQIKFALGVSERNDKSVQVNVFEEGKNRADRQPYEGEEISIMRSATGAITYAVDGKAWRGFPSSNFTGSLLLDVSISYGNIHGLEFIGGWRN